MRRCCLLVLVAVLLAGGCSKEAPPGVVLDGRPRLPDDEGVVVAVSRTSITLEGGRPYRISRKLQSFSSATLEAVPLLQRKDQYVQLGLRGDTVVWLASISAVVGRDSPTALHIGTLKSVDRKQRNLVFEDGTVLRLADDVVFPPVGRKTTAEINPALRRVRSLTVAPG